MRQKRVGIAWVSSTWRSQLLEWIRGDYNHSLNDRSPYNIIHNPAATIIRTSLAQWETLKQILSHPVDFQNRVHGMRESDFWLNRGGSDIFFDTTLVDDIAHRKLTWVETTSIQETIDACRYDHIFYLSHTSIAEDEDRIMELDKLTKEAYKDNGYDIIEVPAFIKSWEQLTEKNIKKAVESQVKFVFSNIE